MKAPQQPVRILHGDTEVSLDISKRYTLAEIIVVAQHQGKEKIAANPKPVSN